MYICCLRDNYCIFFTTVFLPTQLNKKYSSLLNITRFMFTKRRKTPNFGLHTTVNRTLRPTAERTPSANNVDRCVSYSTEHSITNEYR